MVNKYSDPIIGKGDKSNPENYRGINLLNCTLKLLTKTLTINVNEHTELADEQGFRSGRSSIDAIFILWQIIEKSLEFNKLAFLCFVDLQKAFDTIQLKDVIQILYQKQIAVHLIKLTEDIYSGNLAMIKLHE
jgi:hypothetical protein